MNKDKTAWDRLRDQFKPDSKGRFKTADAMKIAQQIDNERKVLELQLKTARQELDAYKNHLRAVTSTK
jgi:hypothetical protein